MDNCNCKKPKKSPFPAMSAHFAHTLDDMEEKYVRLQFIELSAPSGIIEKDKLELLLKSRENKIVYNNCIYNLITINENIYSYISNEVKNDDGDYIEFNNLTLDKNTGAYTIKVIRSKDGQIIQDLNDELINMKTEITTMKTDLDKVTEIFENIVLLDGGSADIQ